jgi:hypothetical protein
VLLHSLKWAVHLLILFGKLALLALLAGALVRALGIWHPHLSPLPWAIRQLVGLVA